MDPISQFEATVDAIYGVYLDSTSGFEAICSQLHEQQSNSLGMLKNSHPELATREYLDSTHFIYGKGDPNSPNAVELHRCTQKEYRERNSADGLNYLFIGNMMLIALYQYWEDRFRAEIASALGKEKNDLSEPIMGDIRRLRITILHHSGEALPDIEKCEVLRWFSEGDQVYLDKEKVETVIYEVKRMIKGLGLE